MKTDDKRSREKAVVSRMIAIYCSGHHGRHGGGLCAECEELNAYAATRVDCCPYMKTKTFCSSCKTHCFRPDMREKIRIVMRYSGPRIIFYHPAAALRHAIESRNKRTLKDCRKH